MENVTALIGAVVNGNVSENSVPTDIVFETSSTSGSQRSERLRITQAGRVLIGTTAEGHSNADDLTIGTAGGSLSNTGITIRSGTSNDGNIFFSDATSGSGETKGVIKYNHGDDKFTLNVNGSTRLSVNSSGNANFTGIVTATEFVPTVNQTGGFKNLIINGDAQVAQYGTSTSVEGYACDRFHYLRSGINEELTISQHALTSSDTGPWESGLRNSIHLQNGNQTGGAGASDYAIVRYKVEAQDLATSGWDYTSSSSYITLSYWVKSSVAQNFYSYMRTHDGTDKAFTWETGALSANTWKKIVVRVPGESGLTINNDNGIGMLITFAPYWGGTWTDNGVGLNSWHTWGSGNTRTPDYTTTWWNTNDATFEITGLQFEVGSEPTPFEHISYGQQLARSQRYFYALNNSNSVYYWFHPIDTSSNYRRLSIRFPTTMRATPTASELTGNNAGSGGTPTGTQHADRDHIDIHWDSSGLVELTHGHFQAEL